MPGLTSLGEKQLDLKEKLFEAYNGYCAMDDCFNRADDMHHIFPQTKKNKEKFPLFIHSPFNLMPICNGCHLNKPLPKKPGLRLVQLFEDYLASNVTPSTSLK